MDFFFCTKGWFFWFHRTIPILAISCRYYEKISDLRPRSRTLQKMMPAKHEKQIELDLHSTFPGNKHFQVCVYFFVCLWVFMCLFV